MAQIIGHWNNLAEAQKLTQALLLSGIVETVIEAGQILNMMPVKQLNGQSLDYNREKTWAAETGAEFVDIGEQIPWQSGQEYQAKVSVSLKEMARQDRLDTFIKNTYNSHNDYRSVAIQEITKRMVRFTEHMLFYGDSVNTGAKHFDGLHRLNQALEAATAAASVDGTQVNIDGGETALGLSTLRALLDACKVEQVGRQNVAILMPPVIARKFDAAYQEAGFVRASVTVAPMTIPIGARMIGTRIPWFDDVPIIRTDFLRAEQANTGVSGASARALNTSGTKQYSIFVVRLGHVEEGGLEMIYGDPNIPGSGPIQENEFRGFAHYSFPVLENYIAGGERVWGFMAPALGAAHSLGRIFDITDAALVP